MYLFIEVNSEKKASLFLTDYQKPRLLARKTWACERDLSRSLLLAICSFLKQNELKLEDLTGLGVFAGPAGFTDLRISHAVANALAYGLDIPIVNAAARSWRQDCHRKLKGGADSKIIRPNYGRAPRVTKRKK